MKSSTSVSGKAWFALYPYGGGGVGAYRPLAPLLGEPHLHVPVLPGRDSRCKEPALTAFDALTDDLWGQLYPELSCRGAEDLVLFGYSLGGMLAFDMARRIEDGGATPRALVVGGAASPDRWSHTGVSHLPEEAFVDRLRTLGIAPAELLDEPWVRKLFMPVWRADTMVAESIRPAPASLRCPVFAVTGDRDPLAGPQDLEGWARAGGPGSTSSLIRGDHGTLVKNQVLIARTIWQATAEPRQPVSSA